MIRCCLLPCLTKKIYRLLRVTIMANLYKVITLRLVISSKKFHRNQILTIYGKSPHQIDHFHLEKIDKVPWGKILAKPIGIYHLSTENLQKALSFNKVMDKTLLERSVLRVDLSHDIKCQISIRTVVNLPQERISRLIQIRPLLNLLRTTIGLWGISQHLAAVRLLTSNCNNKTLCSNKGRQSEYHQIIEILVVN
jgi:hypothetical protein